MPDNGLMTTENGGGLMSKDDLDDKFKKFLKKLAREKNRTKKETLDDRLKKFFKNVAKEKNRKKYERLFKKFMKKERNKFGAFVGVGTGAGLIEGGSLGVAMVGTAFGVPLAVAGAVAGVAGYGAYKAGEAFYKNKKKKEKDKERKKAKKKKKKK